MDTPSNWDDAFKKNKNMNKLTSKNMDKNMSITFLSDFFDILKFYGLLNKAYKKQDILKERVTYLNINDLIIKYVSSTHWLTIDDSLELHNYANDFKSNIRSTRDFFLGLISDKKEFKLNIDISTIYTNILNNKHILSFEVDDEKIELSLPNGDMSDDYSFIIEHLNKILNKKNVKSNLYRFDVDTKLISIIFLDKEIFNILYNNRMMIFTDFDEYPEIIEWRKNISEEDLLF
ncbi:MAG: hypothetical protein EAZ44_07155 [Cytophagia bacterium]|nr:MAG: hypothetical protein EAZ44_07155 [Cytophagia bacterium]